MRGEYAEVHSACLSIPEHYVIAFPSVYKETFVCLRLFIAQFRAIAVMIYRALTRFMNISYVVGHEGASSLSFLSANSL